MLSDEVVCRSIERQMDPGRFPLSVFFRGLTIPIPALKRIFRKG
jgi:hypothetical protein